MVSQAEVSGGLGPDQTALGDLNIWTSSDSRHSIRIELPRPNTQLLVTSLGLRRGITAGSAASRVGFSAWIFSAAMSASESLPTKDLTLREAEKELLFYSTKLLPYLQRPAVDVGCRRGCRGAKSSRERAVHFQRVQNRSSACGAFFRSYFKRLDPASRPAVESDFITC